MNKFWYSAVLIALVFTLAACTPDGLEPPAGVGHTTTPAAGQLTQATPTLVSVADVPSLLPLHPDAVPETLPIYMMAQDPIPLYGDATLAWAQSFGFINAEVVEVSAEMVRIVSQDAASGLFEELTFIDNDYERVIVYSGGPIWQSSNSPTVTPIIDSQKPKLLPSERVTAVALEFVREHQLLPEPMIAHEFPSYDDYYQVHVAFAPGGFRLTGIGEVPGVTVRIDGNGRVVEARIVEANFAVAETAVVRLLSEVYSSYLQGQERNGYFNERAQSGSIEVDDLMRFQAHSLPYGSQGDRAELVYAALPFQPERFVPMWLITRPEDQSWQHYYEFYLLAVPGENVPYPVPSPTVPAPAEGEPAPTNQPAEPQPPAPTTAPIPTMTPATAVPLAIDSFELLEIEELDPGKRLTFEWSTSGAGGACLVSGTARRMGPWWQVPLSGTLTVEVFSTLYRDPSFTLQAYSPGGYCAVPEAPPDSEHYVSQSVPITWACELDYFFSPAPQRCPLEPAVTTAAAEQVFENGRMIWLEHLDVIYVLYPNGEFRGYYNEWSPGGPESDPQIIPPEGLYQPVRGFGNVWREQPGVREQLGWALSPERGFETIVQSEHHEGSSTGAPFYLRDRDGQVLCLFGMNFAGSWGFVAP